MDISTIILWGVGLVIGLVIGYFIAAKTNIIENFSEKGRKHKKLLNNPGLLVDKLNEHGKIISLMEDEEYKYSVKEVDGIQQVHLDKVESLEKDIDSFTQELPEPAVVNMENESKTKVEEESIVEEEEEIVPEETEEVKE